MLIYDVVFLIVAFVRLMKVSILILVFLFITMLFVNTNKFKVLMTMTDVKMKYYLGMKHQYAIQVRVFLKVFAVAI